MAKNSEDTVRHCHVPVGGSDDPEFSQEAREVLTDPGNEIYLSSVSAWEIAVKHALGKLPLPEPPGRFVPLQRKQHGIDPLPLDEDSALHLSRLPLLHRDPFDPNVGLPSDCEPSRDSDS